MSFNVACMVYPWLNFLLLVLRQARQQKKNQKYRHSLRGQHAAVKYNRSISLISSVENLVEIKKFTEYVHGYGVKFCFTIFDKSPNWS